MLAGDLHMAGFEVRVGRTATTPVIDFEITANRPDCLSVIGMAREVATQYGTSLHAPQAATLGAADREQPRSAVGDDREPDRLPALLRGHR